MRPVINHDTCIGCGNCHNVCPADPNVFEADEHDCRVINPQACTGCLECEVTCPTSSIFMQDE